ncbi:MAG TPA: TetR/AcrR family transcriptional regulator [Acidimicrobiales bacterium]
MAVALHPPLEVPGQPGAPSGPEDVIEAVRTCISRFGLTRTTLDDVAAEAGISRATLYRQFPGGRDRLLGAVVEKSLAEFGAGLDRALTPVGGDLAGVVSGSISYAASWIDDPAIGGLLRNDPERVVAFIALGHFDAILAPAERLLGPWLAPHLGAHAAEATSWLCRVVLTYLFRPSPSIDLADPADVRRLTDTYLVPGLERLGSDNSLGSDDKEQQ